MEKIAVINDLSGIGRCSLNVAISIVASCGLQPCPLPTALLSNQTGFKTFSFLDFTPYMREYFEHWKQIGYDFDGIYSGFLGSKQQVELIIEFIKLFKKEATLVLIDPVMGDNGMLYSIYEKDYPSYMKKLISYAEVITPNKTEFALLTGYDWSWGVDKEKIYTYAKELSKLGPKQIVITGVGQSEGSQIVSNLGMDFNKNEFFEEKVAYNGISYSGTGDIFASILAGQLTKGKSLRKAVQTASTFIAKAVAYTASYEISPQEGILYEVFLKELGET
ncbi:pyridoxine kinase [Sporanaerobium hydrogeniformans]|uniref:Pyridoxine kinase n=1 Tax=Sporanaerobium hydrogeniformans TaxID=3072179 RepID=A0AC61D662_9FIRM|nr:pyridoxamine kinase [Sporanaerobium hydrogeniformans]PHV69204.1 pyridoxine kinase [Sporanaerobium hydrogeniformans]